MPPPARVIGSIIGTYQFQGFCSDMFSFAVVSFDDGLLVHLEGHLRSVRVLARPDDGGAG